MHLLGTGCILIYETHVYGFDNRKGESMVTITKPNSTETRSNEIDEGLLGLNDAEKAAITVDELLEELFRVPKAPQTESLPSRGRPGT